eukprot:365554-Chlamydomonas_euryale.AAC.2
MTCCRWPNILWSRPRGSVIKTIQPHCQHMAAATSSWHTRAGTNVTKRKVAQDRAVQAQSCISCSHGATPICIETRLDVRSTSYVGGHAGFPGLEDHWWVAAPITNALHTTKCACKLGVLTCSPHYSCGRAGAWEVRAWRAAAVGELTLFLTPHPLNTGVSVAGVSSETAGLAAKRSGRAAALQPTGALLWLLLIDSSFLDADASCVSSDGQRRGHAAITAFNVAAPGRLDALGYAVDELTRRYYSINNKCTLGTWRARALTRLDF